MVQRDRLDWLSSNWNRMRPDIDIRPWQVWGRLTRINELFLSAVSRVLGRHELTFTEYQTLGALVLAGEPFQGSPNEIARFNLLTSGGTTNLLSRMEREGLIRRYPDPDDRRGVVVQATTLGIEHFSRAIIEENEVEHVLLNALSEEEREVLAILLRKLILSIDRNGFSDDVP